MTKALFVDGDNSVRGSFVKELQKYCDVKQTSTLREAIEILKNQSFDIGIFDMDLPDGNGFELFEKPLKQQNHRNMYKIALSEHTTGDFLLMGYQSGIHDIMAKPLQPALLAAKVKTLMKSWQRQASFDFGSLRLNPYSHEVLKLESGEFVRVDLTPTEFRILITLAQANGDIVSRSDLISQAMLSGAHIVDRAIDVHVSKLRKKLQPYDRGIRTIYGNGYLFDTSQLQPRVEMGLSTS